MKRGPAARPGVLLALLAALALAACRQEEAPAPPAVREAIPPRFATVGGIQARDTEVPGLVADLLTASRAEGRLTVAVRFRNTGSDTVRFALSSDGGAYPSVRLEAAGRTWPIVRNESEIGRASCRERV